MSKKSGQSSLAGRVQKQQPAVDSCAGQHRFRQKHKSNTSPLRCLRMNRSHPSIGIGRREILLDVRDDGVEFLGPGPRVLHDRQRGVPNFREVLVGGTADLQPEGIGYGLPVFKSTISNVSFHAETGDVNGQVLGGFPELRGVRLSLTGSTFLAL